LDWTSDGSEIVFIQSTGQAASLARISVDGGEPQRLSFGEGADWLSIARTGGRLVYVFWEPIIDIWRTGGPKSPESVSPKRFAFSSSRVENMAAYSPDGSKIVFVSDRLGDPEIWRSNADGRELRKLTDLGDVWTPSWSPDSDQIAFCGCEDLKCDILVISDTGGPPRNLTNDEFLDNCPSWSPDGQWIYYGSLRDGIWQVCKVPANGGPAEQLTKDGGGFPRVTESGQILFGRDDRIWKLDQGDGGETLVLDKEIDMLRWCTWKENIIYISSETWKGEMFNLISGQTTKLPSLTAGMWHTVSPDGRWILYTRMLQDAADLMLVENFY
jgi:Tol biopolymer transport system component